MCGGRKCTYSVPEVPGRFAVGFGRGFSRGETGVSLGSIAGDFLEALINACGLSLV
jgi:hypothetical protein